MARTELVLSLTFAVEVDVDVVDEEGEAELVSKLEILVEDAISHCSGVDEIVGFDGIEVIDKREQ